ncbi:hypothetical protein C493_08211 [Natronolimnohabitans innermongolicus JCM 12255]|uniref:Uncharacterized protein n=2 Tax=Natronolimnohabitans innermongolicus TaxID=253107 RepID=L9X6P0_9EURY|nr:hypothetical protein C493_08211 [Natronolimnohabitans innermongolicus JCM 12255]
MKLGAGIGVTIVAGCLDEDTTSSDGGSATTEQNGDESDCYTETNTETERITDETESVSAGADWVFHSDLEEGDVVTVEARQIGGEARPALEVEDPYGTLTVDSGPSEMISREIETRHDGRYYFRFHNEALVNSGLWDVRIDVEVEYENEVCE